MTIVILIFAAIIAVGLVFGAVMMLVLKRNMGGRTPDTVPSPHLNFHPSYIAAPIAILALSIVITALFYRQLPADVGYHFKPDGTPDRWFSRETALILMLLPQFFLTILSAGITGGMARMGIITQQSEAMGIKPRTLLRMLGNTGALPQAVLGFVMIDIFSYNANRVHVMPSWAVVLLLGLAVLISGMLIVYIVIKARKKLIYQSEE